ncbi:MAG TPA: DUF4157 domain-containing protein, partial [Candidatus Thermoplasmatota archaeon]|nr:DUF4157 domain-containing protein [Candidatus Thermoplasmatota archaeon]
MAGRAAERSGLLRGAPRSPLHPARAPEAEEKRKLGNQAVLRRMQAKLEVSSPGDAHEREADRIADAVVAQRKAEGPTPKRPDEPKRLQRKAEEPKPKKLDEPKVQRQEDGPAHAAPDAEAIVQAAQGQGSALAPSERAFFEPQLSSDLGGVRLHTGAAAQQAAAQLNAKAFTVGQDIFFAAGRHQPGTAEGRHLLAHELAHTLQQQPGGAARAHRAESLSPKDKAAKADPAKFTKQQGQLVGDTIVFDSVALPKFKAESPRGDLYAAKATLGKLRHAKDYDRKKAAPEPQREKWRRLVGKDTTAAEAALRDLTKGDDKETYLFKPKRGSQSFVGTVAEVAKDMVTPAWDHRGEHRFYDVDHIVELQLGGENELDNMELLDSSINRSSGSLIRNAILDKAQLFVDAMGGDVSHGANAEAVKEKHDLAFDGVVAGKDVEAKEGDFWTADQIQKAAHINKDMVEAIPLDKVGGKGKVIVFTKKSGGFATTFPKDGTVPDTRLVKPFSIDSATWATGKDADPMGTVFFSIPDNHATYFPAKGKADVKRLEGTGKAGLIDAKAVREQAEALHRRKSSPIEIDSFDLTPDGLAAEGNIVLTLPFAKGAKVPFRMLGDDVTFAKTFEADELKGIPPPFKVTGAFLTISASTADPHFAIAGQVDVEIAGLGKGMLAADASLRGFNVEGTFAFDSAL